MNKKVSLGLTISLMFLVAAVTFCVSVLYSTNLFGDKINDLKGKEQIYSKLSEVDKIVRDQALATPDSNALTDELIKGYMNGLGDKYAAYLNAESKTQNDAYFNGIYDGLGLTVLAQPDSSDIKILNVTKGSPSSVAGVKAGDIIVSVNDSPVADLGTDEAMKALEGEIGEKVKVGILRAGENLSFELERKKYTVQTIESSIVDETVGYIKITGFDNNTDESFIAVVNDFVGNSAVTSLVLDVRNNSGGLLESVVAMLDRLIAEGTLVTSVDKAGNTSSLKTTDNQSVNLPMAVLVNQNSASASELFACALRDYNKAFLVGTQTYGKGTMQSNIPLKDGSAIRITTAKFNPPKSENFEGVGLTPDFVEPMEQEKIDRYYELTYEEDNQLQRAVAELKK